MHVREMKDRFNAELLKCQYDLKNSVNQCVLTDEVMSDIID